MSNTFYGLTGVPPIGQNFWTTTVPLDASAPVSTIDDLKVEPPYGSGVNMQLEFRAPTGEHLHVGRYDYLKSDEATDPRPASSAVLDGQVASHDINPYLAEVDILDLASDASGQVIRFDLVLLANVSQSRDSLFGEVRMGEPEPADHVLSNRNLDWPISVVGVTPVPASEWIYNTGNAPMHLGSPVFSGADATDFSLIDNECPSTLAAGDVCSFRVGFSPLSAGSRSAVMSVPINGRPEPVALDGSSPVGLTELVTSGNNAMDRGGVIDARDSADLQFVTQYDQGIYEFRSIPLQYGPEFSFQVTPPQGVALTVGTFHIPGMPSSKTWKVFVTSGREDGCDDWGGTLTVRQLAFASDGTIAQADMTYYGFCSGAMTANMRFRSTISAPEQVKPGPAQIALGAVVPISGTAAPGTKATVLFERRGTSTYVARRNLTADATGHFATSYAALDDYTYYVDMSGYVPVVGSTKIRPTITAARSVKRGQVVTVTGTAIPSSTVQLTFQAAGRSAVVRSVAVDGTGQWVRRYTADTSYSIGIRGLANAIDGPSITVKAS